MRVVEGVGERTEIGRVRKADRRAAKLVERFDPEGFKKSQGGVEAGKAAWGVVGGSGNGLEAEKQPRSGRTGRGGGAEGPNEL